MAEFAGKVSRASPYGPARRENWSTDFSKHDTALKRLSLRYGRAVQPRRRGNRRTGAEKLYQVESAARSSGARASWVRSRTRPGKARCPIRNVLRSGAVGVRTRVVTVAFQMAAETSVADAWNLAAQAIAVTHSKHFLDVDFTNPAAGETGRHSGLWLSISFDFVGGGRVLVSARPRFMTCSRACSRCDGADSKAKFAAFSVV